jgi:hypothetical protein
MERYKGGTDVEALQWQAAQAGADLKAQAGSTASNLGRVIKGPRPTGGVVRDDRCRLGSADDEPSLSGWAANVDISERPRAFR